MRGKAQKDIDLDEIFSHIQQIKEEQKMTNVTKQEEVEPIKIIQENTKQLAGELTIEDIESGDVFEILGEVETTPNENLISIGNLSASVKEEPSSTGVCDICHQGILFERNLSGLVIHGQFFACENCCKDATKENLDIWAESKNAKPEDIKPIAFWLMEKDDKTRLIK
jgi:hypothetical protein